MGCIIYDKIRGGYKRLQKNKNNKKTMTSSYCWAKTPFHLPQAVKAQEDDTYCLLSYINRAV